MISVGVRMMLAVSPFRNQDESQSQMETFSIRPEDFIDFSDGNILESIDFDDIFLDINDGDPLHDLEMDPGIFANISSCGGGEESDINSCASLEKFEEDNTATTDAAADAGTNKDREVKTSSPASASSSGWNSVSSRGEELMNRRDESTGMKPFQKESDSGKISSKQSKNSQGKRKVKVDWTPELHRRFVQAVEQLGVDKAVPSRILEIMGIDCLTRHNIASHLQKYRSHRRHLSAREAEAASWNQRRHMYGVADFPGNGGKRTEANTWLAPTMGFPPMNSMHQFRPLHVWGHPTKDHSSIHMWPKHLTHSSSPPPPPPSPQPQLTWASPLPPTALHLPDPLSHWQRASNPTKLTPSPLCFSQPLATTRFVSPLVPVIPPHQAMYKVNPGFGVLAGQTDSRPLFDLHPSKENIDAALGDILSKPGMPLPLGLKPPIIDSVMGELQRQGVPDIPITHV